MALFGTDGARGVANRDLTAELALAIGKAAGSRLMLPARVVIGRDTRVSSDMLEAAVAAGFTAMGVDVDLVGMLTTPALAHLIKATGASGGVMISASHNPPEDNGIKLLDRDGRKWATEEEEAVEAGIRGVPVGARIGRIRHLEADGYARYIHYLRRLFWGEVPEGLRVVLDLAHGAAIRTAPPVLEALGLKVTAIHASPDGELINQRSGATHPEELRAAVKETGADLGFSFDGDADRLIAVDDQGQVVDGDAILYALGLGFQAAAELAGNQVVATVMSNLGLERALAYSGIELVRTPVGDRWVAEAMRRTGASLGGEQSGHVILSAWAETGDGLLTGLALLREMHRQGRSLHDLTASLVRYPQILLNVPLTDATLDWAAVPGLAARVREAEQDLGADGRVMIRPSGTEPLLRIMVEGRDDHRIRRWAEDLRHTVDEALEVRE